MSYDLFTYPRAPGFKELTTSKDAAAIIAPTVSECHAAILKLLRGVGPSGLTADEVADRLGKSILGIRPRISELGPANLNKIERTGERRKNASGIMAAVWRIKEDR